MSKAKRGKEKEGEKKSYMSDFFPLISGIIGLAPRNFSLAIKVNQKAHSLIAREPSKFDGPIILQPQTISFVRIQCARQGGIDLEYAVNAPPFVTDAPLLWRLRITLTRYKKRLKESTMGHSSSS